MATPVYHVFDMYKGHQGGEAIRTEFLSPEVHYTRDGQPATFWALKGSASRKGNTLTLSVVNADTQKPRETEIVLRGTATAQSVNVITLTNPDIHAHNTFDQPDAVHPATSTATVQGGTLRFTFPPASVTMLSVSLA